ncbi:MAG: hypothetical protein ACR2HY_06810 [Acidimicrobiales bacterium]
MSTAVIPATGYAAGADVSAGDAVTDTELGYDLLFGLVVGTPLVYAVVVLMSVVAGTGLLNALVVAALPCTLSGVFFGGFFPLSRQMARHERAEQAARLVTSPAAPLVDSVAVAPAT